MKLVLSSLKKQEIKKYLTSLAGNNQVLECLSLATSDGNLLVFSNFIAINLEKNRLAAMSASLSGLSIALANACGKKNVVGGIVETDEGIIISGLMPFEEQDLVLLSVFSKDVQHGLALWNFKNYKNHLNNILLAQ